MLFKKLHKLPKIQRVFILLALIALAYGIWGRAIFQFIGALVLLMYGLFPEMWQNRKYEHDTSKD
ncbi:MAG TPA: hypothetical protein VKY35_07615, partial [Aliidiomarina sp.]|nr:hypothetical protein [Aliidiomarina sp.]